MLIKQRKSHPTIPVDEYPNTILVVSDMQFNATGRWDARNEREQTNYEAMKDMLRTVFPDEWVDKLKIIWWYCASRSGADNNVPATMDDPGMYLVSGFDGSIITLLLGGDEQTKPDGTPLTMEEMVNKALSQEIFAFVK